jgi:hypothetical protein
MREEIILKLLEKLLGMETKETEYKKYHGEFVIVRTYSAGVFAGNIESRNGKEVILKNAIRLWQWYGACSLSQLAQEGTKDPSQCKFAIPVDNLEILEAIEILTTTACAEKSIKGVTTWKK